MKSWSINHWKWPRGGRVYLDGDYVRRDEKVEPNFYAPGEHLPQILSDVQHIYDGESALRFAESWGLLGFEYDSALADRRTYRIEGALDYLILVEGVDDREAVERVTSHPAFFPEEHRGAIMPPGDPLPRVLLFSERIRLITKAKQVVEMFEGANYDPIMGARAGRELITALENSKTAKVLDIDIDLHRRQYGDGSRWVEECFEHYLASLVIHIARYQFSSQHRRGVWVGLYTSITNSPTSEEGFPVLHFDALFRFLEYHLLVADGVSAPKRCKDPKCNRLFFPSRKSQEFCPPPPGAKRSRCQLRFDQERKRKEGRA